MGRASRTHRHDSASSPTAVGEQTCTFLRRLHPRNTAENVAADLAAWRVKSATIAKMLERRSAPGTLLWLALTCVYGPDFLCAVLPDAPVWLDEAHRREQRRQLEHRAAAIRTELERLK